MSLIMYLFLIYQIVPRNWVNGELTGTYGNFSLPGQNDAYNTVPFGDEEPLSPSAVPPTTRGFYNEEFSPLNLDADCMFITIIEF